MDLNLQESEDKIQQKWKPMSFTIKRLSNTAIIYVSKFTFTGEFHESEETRAAMQSFNPTVNYLFLLEINLYC